MVSSEMEMTLKCMLYFSNLAAACQPGEPVKLGNKFFFSEGRVDLGLLLLCSFNSSLLLFCFKKMILWSVYCGQNLKQGEMVKPSGLELQNTVCLGL